MYWKLGLDNPFLYAFWQYFSESESLRTHLYLVAWKRESYRFENEQVPWSDQAGQAKNF